MSAPRVPVGLAGPGRKLWKDFHEEHPAGVAAVPTALLLEACRIVDRLARLDDLLEGRRSEWWRVRLDDLGTEATLVVDHALAEARMQAGALKGIMTELRQAVPALAPAPRVTGGMSRDDLANRRAERLAAAAGGHVPDVRHERGT